MARMREILDQLAAEMNKHDEFVVEVIGKNPENGSYTITKEDYENHFLPLTYALCFMDLNMKNPELQNNYKVLMEIKEEILARIEKRASTSEEE